MVGQLTFSIQTLAMMVEKGKFLSQSVHNSKRVHEVSASSSQHFKEVKAVMMLQKGKKVDNKVEMSMAKTTQVVYLDSEDSPQKEKEENNSQEYIPKAPFLQRLDKAKKGKTTGNIIEIFRQININIPLLDVFKQVSFYAKFLKDLYNKKRIVHVQKKTFLIENFTFVNMYMFIILILMITNFKCS